MISGLPRGKLSHPPDSGRKERGASATTTEYTSYRESLRKNLVVIGRVKWVLIIIITAMYMLCCSSIIVFGTFHYREHVLRESK